MRRPGGGCPEKLKGIVGDMYDVAIKYKKDNIMADTFGMEIDNTIKHVYEDVFGLGWSERLAAKYSKGRIRTFENRLWRIKKAIESNKLSSKFGSLFYAPSSVIKSNPQLGMLMDNLHNTNLQYNGRKASHNESFKNIINSMKKEMLTNHFNNEGIFPNMTNKKRFKAALNQANKLEKTIENLSKKAALTNQLKDKNNLDNALEVEDSFYKKGEGKVFADIITHIEETLPNLRKGAYAKWQKKVDKMKANKQIIPKADFLKQKRAALDIDLSKAIESEPMKNALIEYQFLMDDMYDVLDKGISAYANSIKESMKGKYDDNVLDDIVKSIREKIKPEKIKDYYPRYKRVVSTDFLDNLMPHMQKVSDALSNDLMSNKTNVDEAIDELKGYVTGRAKDRTRYALAEGLKSDAVDAKSEYSRNFFTVVKRYVDEVDRFNMIAHADWYTKKSLNASKNLFKNGKPIDGYARATVEMMQDMNARMKGGRGFENDTVDQMAKTMLALEFASKLGWNLRSPLKNATQGLLNIVEFGPSLMFKSKDFYRRATDIKGKKINLIVDEMMEESGFLFADEVAPEVLQGQFTNQGLSSKIKITDKETVEFKDPSWFSPMYDKANYLAGKSGVLMAKVENFNRKSTFKFAFHKMYDQLNNSSTYKNSLRDKGYNEERIEQDIMYRAKNYGLRKTTLLHFDYADIGKASWITNPTGRLLGQFQHYGIKFWEYNVNLARNAKDYIMAKEIMGDRAKKAYSMAMVYFAAPVFASAVTGLDFGGLVQHDMVDKFKQMFALFTGDEEEVKDAFYGKGVLTGLPFIGAPVVSDFLAIGNVLNFMDMDSKTMEKMLTGYEDYNLASDDKKIYELMRILNVQLARTTYRTLPSVMQGKVGDAMQYDVFGLYPSDKSKAIKKGAEQAAIDYLPEDVLAALNAFGTHQKQAVKKQHFDTPSTTKQRGGSIFQGKSILEQ